MNKVESLINSFLEPYRADNDIQAAILTGSYAQENQNKYSDMDIFIVSSDKLNWREQGYKIISNYVIDYFINPPKMIFKEIEEYKLMSTALIISNGKVIFDKTGIVESLKEKAYEIIKRPIEPISNFEIEMIKYDTNYNYEQLKRAYEYDTNEFLFLYYTYLENIICSFGKYRGITLPRRTKIYQYILDDGYYVNKDLNKINDNNFLEILKKCMKNDENGIMYKNITELKDYLLNFVGGFNKDGWKIRGEIRGNSYEK
jgi:predicted nucleotidyltransferase